MNRLIQTKYLAIVFSAFFLSSCVVRTNGKSIPPGQAKKIMGSPSAKPFAPVQRR